MPCPRLHDRPLLISLALAILAVSLESVGKAGSVQDTDRAMRLMRANCLSCHNAEKHKGGLQLTSRSAALKGGDNGPVIAPGSPDKSILIKALASGSDPHMPPRKQLAADQIQLLRRWIQAGVSWNQHALESPEPPRHVVVGTLPDNYQPVLALALSPDEKHLASGHGNRLTIRSVTTNFAITGTVDAHRDAIRSLAWSPDGRFVASGSFRELTLWDAAGLTRVWAVASNLVGHITALKFSRDGDELIIADSVGAQSGWVRVLSAANGAVKSGWLAHGDTIFDLALSRDGTRVVTGGGDKLARIWDLESQKEITPLEHAGAVYGVAFNTNATELATVCADKQFKVWDVKTRETVVSASGKKHAFCALAWAADGKTAVAGDENGRLVSFTDFKRHTGSQSSDTTTERQLGRWGEPVHAVALTRDAKQFFAGLQDGTVCVVNSDGKLLAKLERPRTTGTIAEDPQRPVPSRRVSPTVPAPSFVRDVMPVLARAGCMSGSCHAKAEGQNGFKLSVFSYDPKSDYAEIVKKGRGRRVFPAAPQESLLLLKPTLAIEHGGGQRFDTKSETYRLLVEWIRTGMIYQHTNEPTLLSIHVEPRERIYRKRSSQQLHVEAMYSDGSKRDVTRLADFVAHEKEMAQVGEDGMVRVGGVSGESVIVTRYMGFVDAARITVPADRLLPDKQYAHLPSYNFIDDLARAQFKKLGLFPSELCTDAEFLRRSALDTMGLLPTPDEAREFLADTNPNKRTAWIDHLLAHPAYGDCWANKWADLLRPNPDRAGVKSIFVLDQWLREQFRNNRPYDQFVRDILLAEGSNHRDGPAVIYRDRREPPELTTMFSQLFLGSRMECAKCHHHPNEKWSQNDFYQFAAFFAPVKQKGTGLSPPISGGAETFYFAPGRTVTHPVTEEVMQPRPPDGPVVALSTNSDPRLVLADWITDPRNPFFAKAAVNRVWASFFGRGFVQPVDDFRVSNPAVNEPLLDALAVDFARHGYDLKQLMRTILSSRLYQLSATPNEFNVADTRNFSRAYRRRVPAEVLLDAVNDVTGVADDFNGCPPGTRASQTWSYKVKSQFLDAFGRPNPSSDCPCERDAHSSVVQSLHMMNSRNLQSKLSSAEGRVKKLADSPAAPADIVTELYLVAFSRPPSADELKTAAAAYAAPRATRRTATEDVLWALLNSPEFVFNH
ncbi:MAG: hypothetical protein QOF48_1389 [Verrucomicrobiota bacterium]|jgi:WD40 repeat protein